MDDIKEDGIYLSGLIGYIKPFIRYLLGKWVLLLIFVIAGIFLGFAYSLIQKPKYEAVCTFILEEKQNSLGGLGSIASQFGFDLGGFGGGGGGLFSGDNILEILRSKKIVEKILLSKIDSTKAGSKTLADMYIDFSKLRKKWKNKPQLAEVSFEHITSRLTSFQDTALNIIYEKIVDKSLIVDRVSKKGNLISVQVNASNRDFAIMMAERIVEEAKDLYIFIRIGNAQNSIDKLQRKADSLQSLLNGRTYAAASQQVVDANPGLISNRVPLEIATRDKTVIATLYAEVVKNLEASKMLLTQQTPVIQVIDYPNQTAKDNLKSPIVLIMVGAIVAAMLFFFFMLIRYIIKINM
jgi:uncharacterized protein involved in exopolysaccharide biosynthesis